jgi:hypothetical protein
MKSPIYIYIYIYRERERERERETLCNKHIRSILKIVEAKTIRSIIYTFNCRCNKDGELIGKHMLNNINTFKCRFNKDGENQRNIFEINFFFI